MIRHTGRWLCLATALLANHPNSAATEKDVAPTYGLPTDAAFFPLAVWLQNPSRAQAYKAIGINTFVGLWQPPTEAELAELTRQGMVVIVEQTKAALHAVNNEVIRAWLHKDEPDNAQSLLGGGYGTCVPADEVVMRTREMKSTDPTRPVFLGFGKGVADPHWTGRGPCTGDLDYYPKAMVGADIIAFDVYPVADASLPIRNRLTYITEGMDRLMSWKAPKQRIWADIETTKIYNAVSRPSPTQIRSEVWMAIIAGASGITYFVHEFADGFREDGIFRHPDAVNAIAGINAEIRGLAPILNANDASVSIRSDPTIRVRAKAYQGLLYVLAVSLANKAADGEITLTGYKDAKATVLGESRQLTLDSGRIKDTFVPYGVHIYILNLE
jgi:hypothetical protein